MNINNYNDICRRLGNSYPRGEARAIATMLLEEGFQIDLADALSGAIEALSPCQRDRLEAMVEHLSQGEPIQYVLGKAPFCHRWFSVDKRCLIPRPETEELCRWVEDDDCKGCILDVGTGSGCIAVTLALDCPRTRVAACDISDGALSVAAFNASLLGATVELLRWDILKPPSLSLQRRWNIIVSNPPYVGESERAAMETNVVDYEPGQALFVSDDDPLRFVRAIADYGAATLTKGGTLYLELNPLHAEAAQEVVEGAGFSSTVLRSDQFGKTRFLKGFLS